MDEMTSKTLDTIKAEMERSAAMMDKIMSAAQPGAVFGQPIQNGDYSVITASEVNAGGGYGFGMGGGSGPERDPAGGQERQNEGSGAGSGLGGGSSGRPVAVIELRPEGVVVKPVVDATKLGIALLTALGAMWVAFARMRKAAR